MVSLTHYYGFAQKARPGAIFLGNLSPEASAIMEKMANALGSFTAYGYVEESEVSQE